jgi:hypothetical protein
MRVISYIRVLTTFVVGTTAGLIVAPAWGQIPRSVEWSSETGRIERCPGVTPGSLSYLLRCPGGHPLTSPWLLWSTLGVLLLGTGVALRRRRRATAAMASLPMLVFAPPPTAGPAVGESAATSPVRTGPGLPPRLEDSFLATRGAGAASPVAGPSSPGARLASASAVATAPGAVAASAGAVAASAGAGFPSSVSPSSVSPSSWLPPAGAPADEATIQLLPGRLRLVIGSDLEREFRFARSPGRVPEVTIGRQSGEPPLHIQLAAPTVSRLHARMRFEGGGWRIENLSHTNPLVINGKVHGEGSLAQLLHEGDQLEIGEFVLIYHER